MCGFRRIRSRIDWYPGDYRKLCEVREMISDCFVANVAVAGHLTRASNAKKAPVRRVSSAPLVVGNQQNISCGTDYERSKHLSSISAQLKTF